MTGTRLAVSVSHEDDNDGAVNGTYCYMNSSLVVGLERLVAWTTLRSSLTSAVKRILCFRECVSICPFSPIGRGDRFKICTVTVRICQRVPIQFLISAVEYHIDIVKVTGSIPVGTTKIISPLYP
jgi:hypothetical protein